MADYHFVYKDVEGTSTEWDDIQRKLGNLPPRAPPFKPPPFTPAAEPDSIPKIASSLNDKTEEELEDLEDDFEDDRFLEDYRNKMLAQIKEAVTKPQIFGFMIPISSSNYVAEVTEASANTWVVVILYKEGHNRCVALMNCLEELARTYPLTKFVKIISTDCIPKFPDSNLPTVLVYMNHSIKENFSATSFDSKYTKEGIIHRLRNLGWKQDEE